MTKKSTLPEPTPEYMLKPKLEWVGKVLGMDLYVDVNSNGWNPLGQEDRRKVAETVLYELVKNVGAQ